MKQIRLCDVCFYSELPFLLGCSEQHVRHLVRPPKTAHGDWYRELKFPQPFLTSDAGIRVWFVTDVERWAFGLKQKATGRRKLRGVPILERREAVNELLGI